jgi:hypothetical protein
MSTIERNNEPNAQQAHGNRLLLDPIKSAMWDS